MDKLKKWYRSIPIWLSFFLLAAAALVAAWSISKWVQRTVLSEISMINVKFMEIVSTGDAQESEVFFHTAETSLGDTTNVVVYRLDIGRLPAEDRRRYMICRFVEDAFPPMIYSAGLLSAVLFIYFTKLKKPMTLLERASEKIAGNELDFGLDYTGRDEMAKLCAAFEKMRSALDENNLSMLRMLDERQQLNDAYTHDLRTPIAILKGYTDMLVKYLPAGMMPEDEVIETVQTMSAHVARLEQFVNSMNTAQRIADLTVKREDVPALELAGGIRETAALLCGERGLSCSVTSDMMEGEVSVDRAVVTQVFENLLGNALRFARSKIDIQIDLDGRTLTVVVADDGRGFTGRELVAADRPYYSGQQEAGTYHFGLGLHICRTLCEKHGGWLRLANSQDGGAVVTAAFEA